MLMLLFSKDMLLKERNCFEISVFGRGKWQFILDKSRIFKVVKILQ